MSKLFYVTFIDTVPLIFVAGSFSENFRYPFRQILIFYKSEAKQEAMQIADPYRALMNRFRLLIYYSDN